MDAVADVLEEYRSRGRPVRRVDVTTTGTEAATLNVTLDVPMSVCDSESGVGSGLVPEAAALTDDGLRVSFATEGGDLAAVPTPDAAAVSTDERSVRVEDDGLVASLELTVGAPDDGPAASEADSSVAEGAGGSAGSDRTRPARLDAVRDESVPAYEDTEYLRVLYESCDSFAEMSREIAMDVSSETVRRYMIEAGVHDPTTYDTPASASDGQSAAREDDETESDGDSTAEAAPSAADDPIPDVSEEQLLTDGIGLPAGLDLEDVADAVVDSRTTYEVHTRLGIDQDRTRELLKQLNLHDLVLRRVDDDPERRVPYEEVAARIRQCVPPEA